MNYMKYLLVGYWFHWCMFFYPRYVLNKITGAFIIIQRSRILFSKRDNMFPYESILYSYVFSNFFSIDLTPKKNVSAFFHFYFCYVFKKFIHSKLSPIISYFEIFNKICTRVLSSWLPSHILYRFLRFEATFELHFHLL